MEENRTMYKPIYFCIYILVLLVTLFLLCSADKRRAIFHADVSVFSQIVYGLLLAAGLLAVLGAVNLIVFRSFSLLQFLRADGKTIINFLAFQLLVAVTEEAFFRGYLTELGKKYRVPRPLLVIATAALFGVLHLLSNRTLVGVLVPTFIGVAFEVCYVYSKRCTIYSLMLAHFLYDIAIINFPV